MYPNQPQPMPTPQPTDYLNQIAPQAPKKALFTLGPKLILMVLGVLIIVIVTLAIVLNGVASAQRKPLQQLAARLDSTEQIVNSAQSHLKSSQLRSLNSSLKIYLTNTNRDVAAPLLSAGVNVDKLGDSVTKEESPDAINARLEDARLNAVYDRTYAREMAYQLDTLITLMKQIYASTNNSELKTFLNATYASLEPTQKGFAEFNVAND